MTILRVLAVLFGALALANLFKPLGLQAEHGFVFLGRRLSSTQNAIASITFATFLGLYAEALWRRRSRALPMAIAYAGYVCVNLALFRMRSPDLAAVNSLYGVTYIAIAAGTSLGTVFLLVRAGIADDEPRYRSALRTFALLFGLMALSNVLKPFVYTDSTGFVLLGQRLTGMANVCASITFAAFLILYAASIWMEKRRALILGAAYALYVLANLTLWNFRKPEGADTSLLFAIPYLIIAIGVSSGSAAMLYAVKERLQR
ncbi:MAG: hypothetical protein E4H03_05865 [Myxococcales bacterium]|nr:MAG: hypothetical protein E4H03_05865 [Myxococcales bacterium]